MKFQMKREAFEKMNRQANGDAAGFWHTPDSAKVFGTVLAQVRPK
jgi:hypothetical protein